MILSRNRQQTERALISAATKLFAEKGFDNSTTKAIAEAASCSEALIQRYFQGKEGLLIAILRDEGIVKKQPHILERALCKTIAEEARYILESSIAVFAGRSEFMRILLSRILVDPSFRKLFNELSMRGPVKEALSARLLQYKDAGMLRDDVDITSSVELLMSLNLQLGFVHREIFQSDDACVAKLVIDFSTMFERAVSHSSS